MSYFALKNKTKTEKRRYEETFKTIKKYTTKEDQVLVLGSHDDYIVNEVNFKQIYLVDLKFGERKYKSDPNIFYYEMDLNEFIDNVEESGFKTDVIIMSSVIEHLTIEGKNLCLRRIKKLLKPNGIFILSYPNCRSMNRLLGREMGLLRNPSDISEGDKEVGHKNMYCVYSINMFTTILDLKLVDKRGFMFKPIPNAMMDKYFSDKLDTFIEIGKELGINACAYITLVYKNESSN